MDCMNPYKILPHQTIFKFPLGLVSLYTASSKPERNQGVAKRMGQVSSHHREHAVHRENKWGKNSVSSAVKLFGKPTQLSTLHNNDEKDSVLSAESILQNGIPGYLEIRAGWLASTIS